MMRSLPMIYIRACLVDGVVAYWKQDRWPVLCGVSADTAPAGHLDDLQVYSPPTSAVDSTSCRCRRPAYDDFFLGGSGTELGYSCPLPHDITSHHRCLVPARHDMLPKPGQGLHHLVWLVVGVRLPGSPASIHYHWILSRCLHPPLLRCREQLLA